MRRFCQLVRDFLKREDGPTAVEYAILLALIISVCFSAVTAMAGPVKAAYNKASTAFVLGS